MFFLLQLSTLDDGYGEQLYNTKPELLCRPDPRNITGNILDSIATASDACLQFVQPTCK